MVPLVAEPRTLHLLGLQYELALLIGKGIVLEPMLRAFFPSALKRLGCRSAFVWLSEHDGAEFRLRYAYPRHERGRVEAEGDLADFAARFEGQEAKRDTESSPTAYLHWYPLATRGYCLLVCDRGPIDELTRVALQPIMARLGDACFACLEHEHAQTARAGEAEKETQLRETILENSVVGIAFLNPEGRLVWGNGAMARIFGTERDLVAPGASLEPFYVSRQEYLRVHESVSNAVRVGGIFVEELKMRRANGELFWAHLSGKAVNPKDLSRGTVWVVMDITQSRSIHEALERSSVELEAIFETVTLGITVVRERRFVRCNRRFEELLGYPPDGLIGRSSRLLYASDEDFNTIGAAAYPMLAQGGVHHREQIFQRLDGTTFLGSFTGKAFDASRPNEGSVWMLEDITERRELEDELRHRTAEQEAILQSTQIGIAFTVNRVHQWVNRTFANMVGFTVDELIGDSSRKHFPDEGAFQELGEAAYPFIARGEAFAGERRFRHKNGEVFPVQMYGKAVDAANPAKGAIWTVIDLTERHRLEGELEKTSRERELILQSTLVGIIFSRQRRNQWVNEAMASMLGYSADEMIGQPSRLQFPSDESWARFGDEAYICLAANEAFSTEWQLAHKDGSTVWVHIIGKAVDPRQPLEASIWTVADITQRKQAEEDTRRALEQQKELNELKTRFVSMASHEFRTPLATILSSSELIRYYGDRLPPEEKNDLLGSIEKGVKRMTEMLDNILVIGRTDAGKLEFVPVPVDVAGLCRAIAEESARAYAPSGGLDRLDFRIDCPAAKAMLDEKLVRHILGNLLSNAFKYSPAGGRVRFSASLTDGQLSLRVEDSGIGIPPEDVPRLFETFHRAANVGNISGTGLGMAIVKRATELHGGTIAVASSVGVGTRFTVSLPWQPVAVPA